MKTKISFVAVMLLAVTYSLQAQETVFSTGFEYDGGAPFVLAPGDLNGASDQIGEWSGDDFPDAVGGGHSCAARLRWGYPKSIWRRTAVG